MDSDTGEDMYDLLNTLIGSYICETFFFGATTFLIHPAY